MRTLKLTVAFIVLIALLFAGWLVASHSTTQLAYTKSANTNPVIGKTATSLATNPNMPKGFVDVIYKIPGKPAWPSQLKEANIYISVYVQGNLPDTLKSDPAFDDFYTQIMIGRNYQVLKRDELDRPIQYTFTGGNYQIRSGTPYRFGGGILLEIPPVVASDDPNVVGNWNNLINREWWDYTMRDLDSFKPYILKASKDWAGLADVPHRLAARTMMELARSIERKRFTVAFGVQDGPLIAKPQPTR